MSSAFLFSWSAEKWGKLTELHFINTHSPTSVFFCLRENSAAFMNLRKARRNALSSASLTSERSAGLEQGAWCCTRTKTGREHSLVRQKGSHLRRAQMGGGKEEVAAVRSEKRRQFCSLFFCSYSVFSQISRFRSMEKSLHRFWSIWLQVPRIRRRTAGSRSFRRRRRSMGNISCWLPSILGKPIFFRTGLKKSQPNKEKRMQNSFRNSPRSHKQEPTRRKDRTLNTDRPANRVFRSPASLYLLTSAQGNMYSLYPPVIVEIKSGSESPIRIFPKVQYPAFPSLRRTKEVIPLPDWILNSEFMPILNAQLNWPCWKAIREQAKLISIRWLPAPLFISGKSKSERLQTLRCGHPHSLWWKPCFHQRNWTAVLHKFAVWIWNSCRQRKIDFDITTDEDSSESSSDSSSSSSSSDDSSKSSGSSDSSSDSNKLTSTSNSNSSHDPSHRGNGLNTAAEMGIRYLLMILRLQYWVWLDWRLLQKPTKERNNNTFSNTKW